MNDEIIIRQKDIKIRRNWSRNPETKIEPVKKRKRERDNLRKHINEEIYGHED